MFEERRGGHQEVFQKTICLSSTFCLSQVQLVGVARRHRPPRQRTNSGIYQFDNYSCPHCLRKFSAKSGLKIHVGIAHKGGKLLFCPRCPASFADVTSCKSHFKVFSRTPYITFLKLSMFGPQEEHSAGRQSKRKADSERETPKRSLVPTNEPVEGIRPMLQTKEVEEVEEVNSVEVGVGEIRLQEEDLTNVASKTDAEVQNGNSTVVAKKPQTKDASTKTKPRKPIPGLVKIQDLVSPESSPKVAAQKTKLLITRKPSPGPKSSFGKITPVPTSTLKPIGSPVQVMTSLVSRATSSNPITLAPSVGLASASISASASTIPATTTTSQVYVPALTSTGTTILMRLEEAQHHLQRGSVTFLPSAPAASGPPILGQQQQILLAPRSSEQQVNIMRDKVALNLPVVMTKRTNKKLAQDNPFFSISVGENGLTGECRVCQAVLFIFIQIFTCLYRLSSPQHSRFSANHIFIPGQIPVCKLHSDGGSLQSSTQSRDQSSCLSSLL